MAMGLISLALDNRIIQISHIDQGQEPGGGLAYELSNVVSGLPISCAVDTAMFVVDILTTVMQIWRTWIVWSTTGNAVLIILVPVLLFVAFTGVQIAENVILRHPNLYSRQVLPSLPLASQSLSISIASITTILISTRIAIVRRRHIEILDTS